MKRKIILICAFVAICSSQLRAQSSSKIVSIIEIIDATTGKRSVLREIEGRVEAPNWTLDGKSLIYNGKGHLYKITVDGKSDPVEINTDFATNCNNDHVLSFDGKEIAISHGTKEDGKSRIYTLPMGGGTPQLITPMSPSYLHGWSPDGKMLSYCAERNGNYDIYVIPARGGVEKRLTNAEGLDDGAEYSPCGNYLWFNSVRSGLMQVWRMKADGSEQTQMTFDENLNSWFPHVSPDNKRVVYISYKKGDVAPGDHPADKNVQLNIIPAEGGKSRLLVQLFGGQGTLNVNSWSPDSKKLAFVSYRLE